MVSVSFRGVLAVGLGLLSLSGVGLPSRAQSVSAWETPEYFRSGGLAQINAAAAYALGFTGAGVKVGVADSGLWTTHPEFAGRVLPGFDFSYRATPLPVFLPPDDGDNFDLGEIPDVPPPEGGPLLPGMNRDQQGHGTHVAGIIAAARNGEEMHGVAFNSLIVPVHVNVLGTDAGTSEGWPFLIAQGVSIINASYAIKCFGPGAGTGCDAEQITRAGLQQYYPLTIQRSIDLANAQVLMVVAAGNDSKTSPDILAALPAVVPEVKDNWLAVVAVDSRNVIASFSDRCGIAKEWCLAAPGDDIYSTWRVDAAHPTGYKIEGGTSMAAPTVSGVAALVKEAFPWFTARDLQQTLLTTATDLGAPGVDEIYGWGMVNAGKAVRGYGMFTSVVTLDTKGYVSTFSNDISGTGGLVKTGEGTLILTGANTYSGGASVTGGMLVLGSSMAAGTGTVTIGDGAALGFGDGVDVANALIVAGNVDFNVGSGLAVASGVLSGAGTLSFTGGGLLLLTGDASGFLGTTAVSGTLSVNGALGGSVVVENGGTLMGSGSVGPTLVASGGAVAPGNSIGTLTVNGTLTFSPGATYEVEINATGASDLVLVNGTATLGGATVAGSAASGVYIAGTRYTILTATGGLSGTFGLATETLPFLDFALSYDPNTVYLDIVRDAVPLTSAAVTRNQTATAVALDSLPEGNDVLEAVLSQASLADAQQAFNALSGEAYPSALSALQGESLIVRRAVLDRARLAPAAPVRAPLAYGATSGADVAPVGDTPAAFWSQVFGAWEQISGDGNAASLSGTTSGLIIGYDRTVSGSGADWRLGFAAGYSSSSYQVDARGASLSGDNAHVAVYGGARLGALGLRVGGAYEWSDISAGRSVLFPAFSESLSADMSARTGQVFGEAGYSLAFPGVEVEPFAGLAYVDVHLGSFTEAGGLAALTSAGTDAGVTYSTLGARFSVPLTLGTMSADIRGLLGWQHAFGDTTPQMSFAFASGSPAFSVAGVPIASDAALVEAGLDLNLSANAGLSVFYAGQLASSQTTNMVKGTFSLRF